MPGLQPTAVVCNLGQAVDLSAAIIRSIAGNHELALLVPQCADELSFEPISHGSKCQSSNTEK